MAEKTAADFKIEGNAAFSAGKYKEAIDLFGKAIEKDPSNHVLYSNRSAAQNGAGDYDAALTDAEKCIELNPSWAKGYSRKGAALHFLKRFQDALDAYDEGLKLDPQNAQLLAGVESASAAMKPAGLNPQQSTAGNQLTECWAREDLWDVLKADPQISIYCKMPDFVETIEKIRANPESWSQYVSDQRIMAAWGKLMGIPVMTTPEQMSRTFGDQPGQTSTGPVQPPQEKEAEPEVELTEEEKALKAKKEDALKAKEAGNKAYSAKDFATAHGHYDKAIELDPTDAVFLLNKAAVFVEEGNTEEAVNHCKKAIDVARANRQGYKVIAKAYARMATAYERNGQLNEAINAYETSLTEDRTPLVTKKLKACKRAMEKKKAEDYLDDAKAEEERQRGNDLFREGKFTDAIAAYTEASKRNPKDAKIYNNRAAALSKMMDWSLALQDCEKAIDLDEKYIKAYARKANVHLFLKQFPKAIETYKAGLELEPENAELKAGLMDVYQKIQANQMAARNTGDRQKIMEAAMQDPEIAAIMQDPVFNEMVLKNLNNKDAMAEYSQNPEIMDKLSKLIAAGVLQTG